MKKVFRILLVVVLVITGILLAMVTTIDRTPYQEMDYYAKWKAQLEQFNPAADTTTRPIMVGFAKANITPPYPTPMAGYGNRRGKPFEVVHDSIYVRTILVANGKDTIALTSADLLIIPPSVYELVNEKIANSRLQKTQIYYGATHSHNSVGAWYDTLVGKLFAGTYNPEIEEIISEAIISSITDAKKNLVETTLSYEMDTDTVDIKNRLVGIENGTVDPQIRSVIFNRVEGKPLIFTTYAAHSTVLDSKTLQLSRDYAGKVVDSLEESEYEFAVFMAGAVGSMGPQQRGIDDFDEVNNQGGSVANEIFSANEYESQNSSQSIRYFKLKLPLREPTPRLTQKFALRTWVFYQFFGKSDVFVNVAQIGNNLLVGMPCDFSGELMKPLTAYAKSKNLNLVVTIFNGGYIGYVTDDRHFYKDTYETITMSWYGPDNGTYLSEVIKDLIDKVADSSL
jgi:neutral ceramidase